MLHLRLTVPPPLTADALEEPVSSPGVVHIVRYACHRGRPPGDLVSCDVAREAANDVVEALQRRGLHQAGAITLDPLEVVVSDAAARTGRHARRGRRWPGVGGARGAGP